MFNRDLFKNKYALCHFLNGELYVVIMTENGKVIKKEKCEDEIIYNYLLELML